MISPVILAGGKGVRLWPVSRETLPKPYVRATGSDATLLQATLRRLAAHPRDGASPGGLQRRA